MGNTQNHRKNIEQWLAVGGGWPLAVAGWLPLAADSGWQLMAAGGWRLAVGGPWGLSSRAVVNQKKTGVLKDSPAQDNRTPNTWYKRQGPTCRRHIDASKNSRFDYVVVMGRPLRQ